MYDENYILFEDGEFEILEENEDYSTNEIVDYQELLISIDEGIKIQNELIITFIVLFASYFCYRFISKLFRW